MTRDLENLLENDDGVTSRRKAYERMFEIIKQQADEIEALEYRVKTLLGDK